MSDTPDTTNSKWVFIEKGCRFNLGRNYSVYSYH